MPVILTIPDESRPLSGCCTYCGYPIPKHGRDAIEITTVVQSARCAIARPSTFCSETCANTWWHEATEEPYQPIRCSIKVHAEIERGEHEDHSSGFFHSEGGSQDIDLDVSVVHTKHDGSGPKIAFQKRFKTPHELNKWWQDG